MVPLPLVIVRLPAGTVADVEANSEETQEAAVARLFTWMTWLPCVLPAAAVAVTTLEFDDVTEDDARGPVMLFNC